MQQSLCLHKHQIRLGLRLLPCHCNPTSGKFFSSHNNQNFRATSKPSKLNWQQSTSKPPAVLHYRGCLPQTSRPPTRSPQSEACRWCGRSPSHRCWVCPAQNSHCQKCSKNGHWTAVCLSCDTRSMAEVCESPHKMQSSHSWVWCLIQTI